MIARPIEAGAAPPDSPDVAPFLDVLDRMLALPESARRTIREELDSHLRERIRDLVLAGKSEHDAIRAAISELGEAADLATRYRDAHRTSRRRLIMNVVIPVLAIAVVGGTATILTEPSPAPRGPSTGVSFFDDAAGQAQGLPDTSVTVGGDDLTTLVEVTEQLASLTGLQVTGDWEVLVDLGVSKDLELEIEVRDQRLPIALRAIERALPGQPAARWVLSGEALLLTSDEAADRIEARLATYEIERVLDHIMDRDSLDPDEARDALRGLIYQFVEPDSWREMGGDAAQLSVVGGKLFVEAPDRMHARIRWILDELTPVDEEARLGRPGARIGAPGAGGGFGSAQDYDTMLRPGDLVTVEIYGLYELDEWFRLSRRVDEAGVLRLPELGDVPAAGRTRAVLEDDLHGRLTEFISNPRCLVKLESEVSAR